MFNVFVFQAEGLTAIECWVIACIIFVFGALLGTKKQHLPNSPFDTFAPFSVLEVRTVKTKSIWLTYSRLTKSALSQSTQNFVS